MTANVVQKAFDHHLLDTEDLTIARRVYFFKKWIDANEFNKDTKSYIIKSNPTVRFFKDFIEDKCAGQYTILREGIEIKRSVLNKIYDQMIAPLKAYFNSPKGLNDYATIEQDDLIQVDWNKYCTGTESTWEMDSLSYYYHDHELKGVNPYGISPVDFETLPFDLQPSGSYTNKKGEKVNTYDVKLITGTVIGSNKNKHLVFLLTPYGVVDIKFSKTNFIYYNKQIKEPNEKGTLTVTEPSWFTRGTKLAVFGVRREDTFVPKRPNDITSIKSTVGRFVSIDGNNVSLVWARKKS
jgi:DNA polymerase-3 subunit alpha